MYDRATESWWQQFTGEAIVGDLTGTKLRQLPAQIHPRCYPLAIVCKLDGGAAQREP
jgi:hypothetical protein